MSFLLSVNFRTEVTRKFAPAKVRLVTDALPDLM